MASWSDYKKYVKSTNAEIANDIDEVEALSQIVGAIKDAIAIFHSLFLELD
jgi:hypothetical protein